MLLYKFFFTRVAIQPSSCNTITKNKNADESVHCMAKDVQLPRAAEFKSLVPRLRTFHATNVLLECTGRSMEGRSGAYNV